MHTCTHARNHNIHIYTNAYNRIRNVNGLPMVINRKTQLNELMTNWGGGYPQYTFLNKHVQRMALSVNPTGHFDGYAPPTTPPTEETPPAKHG